MKRTLLVLVLLSLAFYSNAQKIRFTDASNKWIVRYTDLDGGAVPVWIYTYMFKTDTVINNKTYKRMSNYSIREDSVSGKVYIRNNTNTIPGPSFQETVLYDYTLKMGDTIWRYYHDTSYHVVTKIDSTLINGIAHKIWYFNFEYPPGGWSGHYFVIEGIGSSMGPTYHVDPFGFESFYDLLCFSHENNTPAVNPAVHLLGGHVFDNQSSCLLSVHEVTPEKKAIVVVPHPATRQSQMMLPHKITGELTVFNIYGQLIFKEAISQKEKIAINNISVPGTYLYQITDIYDNQTYTGRFIYQE